MVSKRKGLSLDFITGLPLQTCIGLLKIIPIADEL